MSDAYLLEKSVLPAVIDMEMKGVKISESIVPALEDMSNRFGEGEAYLMNIVGNVKLGGKAMFNKLREKGYIDEDKIVYTEKGNPRYGKDFLPDLIEDEKLKDVLVTRSRMQKIIGTYLRPWSEARARDGRFYPYFNQIRNEEDYGTMTGRFSSNFQQVPRTDEGALINLRQFILPDEGEVILQRDYSGQELRIAAHYAEGEVLKRFQDNPDFDMHTWVQKEIHRLTGTMLDRKTHVKQIGFLKLYGGGPAAMSGKYGVTFDEAKEFFAMYDRAVPEFKALGRELELQVRSGVLLRTWGGRLYDVEPSKYEKGKRREFYYKLTNVLIQGSAADMMKYAIAQYYHHPDRKGRIMLTVHDELVVSVKPEYVDSEMKLMKYCMENLPGWDLKMTSDGKTGKSFGELEEYKDE